MSEVYGIAFNSICSFGKISRRFFGGLTGYIGAGFKVDIIKVVVKPNFLAIFGVSSTIDNDFWGFPLIAKLFELKREGVDKDVVKDTGTVVNIDVDKEGDKESGQGDDEEILAVTKFEVEKFSLVSFWFNF